MIFTWWWIWLAFMLLLVLPPVGYGWGYRRWGPPYPRYFQRRRHERAAEDPDAPAFDHLSWGWAGDFVWMMFFLWIFWFLVATWWR